MKGCVGGLRVYPTPPSGFTTLTPRSVAPSERSWVQSSAHPTSAAAETSMESPEDNIQLEQNLGAVLVFQECRRKGRKQLLQAPQLVRCLVDPFTAKHLQLAAPLLVDS